MSEEIVGFLRERLGESAGAASSVHFASCPGSRGGACTCAAPGLFRCGVEAMLRELDSMEETAPGTPEYNGYLYLFRNWAAEFAGHPDYQERWAPKS